MGWATIKSFEDYDDARDFRDEYLLKHPNRHSDDVDIFWDDERYEWDVCID